MRRLSRIVLALLVVALVGLMAPPATAAPYCGIRWGSLAKSAGDLSTAPLVNVRAGRHACYDRLVLDFRGTGGGYNVRYVSQVSGSAGFPLAVRGGARLQITAMDPAYDDLGNATYAPANQRELVRVGGFRTFRQVRWVESFEGYTEIGLGVRARLPFRVFTLAGPGGGSRLVIDVAHRW